MSTLDVKIAAARAVGELARRAGRGGGTSLPGKVLTRLEPHAIERLAGRLPQGCAVISSTNGKTTTAAMAASVLERAGTTLVHNRAGANMAGGHRLDAAGRGAPRAARSTASSGCSRSTSSGLTGSCPQLRPRAVLLGNLFRDQLDRYGELETIADRWAAMVAGLPAGAALAANADDPLIADLGRQHAGVRYFGVEDRRMATAEMQHASDSKHCRRCGAAYVYDAIYLGHLGVYHCPIVRPAPARAGRLGPGHPAARHPQRRASRSMPRRGAVDVELPLPGLYNVYNALGAATLCLALGVSLETIAAGLAAVSPAFGRAERVAIGATTSCRSC